MSQTASTESGLHGRLAAVAGQMTFRRLGEITNTNQETVRRYMSGQSPSAEFLAALCRAMGVNGRWLLTGQGPAKVTDLRAHALTEANSAELMTAISNTLTALIERVDRLETYMQTVDTRLRALQTAVAATGITRGDERAERPDQGADGGGGAAERVGRAVAERRAEDAG